jgi:hypothetical protein
VPNVPEQRSKEQQQWEQQQRQREDTLKAQRDAFKAQQAAQTKLWAKQEKLDRLSAGFILNEEHVASFEQQLTPSQKGALTKEVNERYKELTGLAQQADNPLMPYEVAELQQKLRQQVLYERFVPVREIYHFGNQFLNGYTPQKMQAVRGYFDQVFEGGYSKSIPADKRAAILKSADARYTEETGKKPNREDALWKTLRNVEASEKYPDLWTQFRDDLSKAPSQPMEIMTGESLPPLGGFGEGASIAPELLRPETFPTNQKVDGVTNVFESSQAKLRYKLGPNDTDLRGSDITFPKALDEAFQRTGIPRDQFKVTKWGRDIYGKSLPVEYEGPGAAEISIDYAHDAPLGKNGEWQTGPDAPHIGWRVGKGTKRQVGHIIIDDVPAGRSSDKE